MALGRDFIADTGVTFPMLWDATGQTWRDFGIPAQPAAVLIDANGNRIKRWQGAFDEADVLAAIR